MKNPLLTLFLLFALTGTVYAQGQVVDTHPAATIFAIDPQSGQLVPATIDAAILFKDAFIDLVNNTPSARMQSPRMVPGRKSLSITQADPQNNGNAYQLTLQSRYMNQTNIIYSYMYNVDQNTLYFFNKRTNSWMAEAVQGNNVINLNKCLEYGKFNEPQDQPMANAGPADDQQASDDDLPVDTAVSVATVPPALPEYDQPECPTDGYLWQPGYWAYSLASNNYYWVPGVWVAPPTVGYLWTPPYWAYDGYHYRFHIGYWGPTVGFYGGINYGYGYGGSGFYGGEWREGHYRYNTAVVRVNTVVVHNTYVNTTVINRTVVNRSSFNGTGGVIARPNEREIAAMHEHHVMATSEQIRNQRVARADRSQFASAGGGRPANLAAARPPERGPNNQRSAGGNPGGAHSGGSPGPRGNGPGNTTPRANNPGGTGPRANGPGNNGQRTNMQNQRGQRQNRNRNNNSKNRPQEKQPDKKN